MQTRNLAVRLSSPRSGREWCCVRLYLIRDALVAIHLHAVSLRRLSAQVKPASEHTAFSTVVGV